jgi:hypothetical protein
MAVSLLISDGDPYLFHTGMLVQEYRREPALAPLHSGEANYTGERSHSMSRRVFLSID